MESLGKESDLKGNMVNQGISVYGNKGSTDQHAYIQQLRDGVNNFFAVFIRVLNNKSSDQKLENKFDASTFEVEKGVTSGDYLNGFLLGTRQALFENNRESITISINKVSVYSIGMLIALFERAVGIYAFLTGINAYHQPGVEAGKKAAGKVLEIQDSVIKYLKNSKEPSDLNQISLAIGNDKIETIYLTLEHLAANNKIIAIDADSVFSRKYKIA